MKTTRPIAGQVYRVAIGSEHTTEGETVTLQHDDGSYCPWFSRVSHPFSSPQERVAIDIACLEEVTEEGTPYQEGVLIKDPSRVFVTGLSIGDEVDIIGDHPLSYDSYAVVDYRDDLTRDIPWSIPKRYIDLLPAEETAEQDDEVTQANLESGVDYVLTSDYFAFPAGTVVTLAENDGTDSPYFHVKDHSDVYSVFRGVDPFELWPVKLERLSVVEQPEPDQDDEAPNQSGFTLSDGVFKEQHLRYNGVLVGCLYEDGTMHIWSADIPDFKDLSPKQPVEPEEEPVVTRENLERGVVYKLRKGAEHHRLTSDSRVVLEEDDGTDSPFFELADEAGSWSWSWSCVPLESLTTA